MRNPANKQINKHTKVIAISRFSRDNNTDSVSSYPIRVGSEQLTKQRSTRQGSKKSNSGVVNY